MTEVSGSPGNTAAVRTLPLAAVHDVARSTFWLAFSAPEGVRCEPGQFFMLSPATPMGPMFLGRPLSIGDVRDGSWRFLVRSLGTGTAWLRGAPPGTPFRLVGPLGRPFVRSGRPVHRIVAGGIGLAPFFWLARRLRADDPEARIELHYGERTSASHVSLDEDEAALFDGVTRYTDDGSRGQAGNVVDGALAVDGARKAAWYACGPHPMLKAFARRLEERGVTGAQISLEERMACGFGVCQACIVPHRAGSPKYRLLCVEGPVIDPREVEL